MLDKVFMYESDEPNRTPIYLNGPFIACPEELFKIYVDWWNNEFAPDEGLSPDGFNDYHFSYSFCPIDFYDEYRELHKKEVKER